MFNSLHIVDHVVDHASAADNDAAEALGGVLRIAGGLLGGVALGLMILAALSLV